MRRSPADLALHYVLLGIAVLFVLFPFAWLISTSLKTDGQIFAVPPSLLPGPVTFDHYQQIWSGSSLGRFLLNSLLTAGGSTLLALVIGVPAAYGFARFRFRFAAALLALIVISRMFPPVALVVPYFRAMREIGLIDTTIGLILAYVPIVLPLVVWILEGFFRDFPAELEEAAEVDGLGTLGTLTRIVMPLAKPALTVAALFGFLAAWNEFVLALALTRTPAAETLPVGLAGFVTQFQTFWGQMTAASVIYLAPVLVVTVLAQRGLVRGLTAGGIKA
jgi:multiple sugar transport system permease protein